MRSLLLAPVTLAISTTLLTADPLPGTIPLDREEDDLPDRLMRQAHELVERKIDGASGLTMALPREPEARAVMLQEKREHLAYTLGVVDDRAPVQVEFPDPSAVTLDGIPLGSKVTEGPGFEVHQIRWTVLPGFSAEGLYVTPTGVDATPGAPPAMVLLPDAGETPEDILGLTGTLTGRQQMGLRFASAGFRLVIPTTLSRRPFRGEGGDDDAVIRSDQTHREWIYRQAFQMGRHPLGYEIQAALAAVDWLRAESLASTITIAGYGEGGRAALYAAALDERIDHAFVSGAFAPRGDAWSEPIDRNLFDLLPEFGDAEVAALIFPRPLLVEHTEFPTVETPKGNLATPEVSKVEQEFNRIGEVLGTLGAPPLMLFHEANRAARETTRPSPPFSRPSASSVKWIGFRLSPC